MTTPEDEEEKEESLTDQPWWKDIMAGTVKDVEGLKLCDWFKGATSWDAQRE